MSNIVRVIRRLEKLYKREVSRAPSREEIESFSGWAKSHGLADGEVFFVPETWFYDEVLSLLRTDDVVFDVGAGDLRFALLISEKVRKVYAVEVNPEILGRALQVIGYSLPRNIIPICADAREFPLPRDVTVITCLMIHRSWSFPREWRRVRIIYTRRDGVHVLEPKRG